MKSAKQKKVKYVSMVTVLFYKDFITLPFFIFLFEIFGLVLSPVVINAINQWQQIAVQFNFHDAIFCQSKCEM